MSKAAARRRKQSAQPGIKIRVVRLAVQSLIAVMALTISLILPLRWIDPPTTSIMLQRHLREQAKQAAFFHTSAQQTSDN